VTGVELVELLSPTLTVRLGKDIIVGGYARFNAHEVVQVRLCQRDDFGTEICVSSGNVSAGCTARDLAGATLIEGSALT
jgi:hypothetical protein